MFTVIQIASIIILAYFWKGFLFRIDKLPLAQIDTLTAVQIFTLHYMHPNIARSPLLTINKLMC